MIAPPPTSPAVGRNSRNNGSTAAYRNSRGKQTAWPEPVCERSLFALQRRGGTAEGGTGTYLQRNAAALALVRKRGGMQSVAFVEPRGEPAEGCFRVYSGCKISSSASGPRPQVLAQTAQVSLMCGLNDDSVAAHRPACVSKVRYAWRHVCSPTSAGVGVSVPLRMEFL
ncbi:unnamed protein product, partial [Iphiclides podalirius]